MQIDGGDAFRVPQHDRVAVWRPRNGAVTERSSGRNGAFDFPSLHQQIQVAEHVLIDEVTDSQIIRVIADRHHGDDLLTVEEQGQGPLDDDGGFDLPAFLIDPGHAPGQARVLRLWPDQILDQGRLVHA